MPELVPQDLMLSPPLPQPRSLEFKKVVNLQGAWASPSGVCSENPRETLLLGLGRVRALLLHLLPLNSLDSHFWERDISIQKEAPGSK